MPQWYAIKIDPNNLPMCKELYKRLRNELYCEGLADSSLYAYESSLQYQAIDLTLNEFYSRFLQRTITL